MPVIEKIENWKPGDHNSDTECYCGVKMPIRAMRIGFAPSWWHTKHGIEFGEKYVFDPDYRVETVRYKWAEFNRMYPDMNVGASDPEPAVIGINFANAAAAAAFGCEVIYPVNNYPLARHFADEDAVMRVKIPEDIENTFPYSEMISQIKYLNRKLGADRKPGIGKNGILNDAFSLRGDELFADLAEDNALGKRMMDMSLQFGLDLYDYNESIGIKGGGICLANCTAELIGPSMYEDWQLDYDREYAGYARKHGGGFVLHHCGDSFDDFIEVYKKLPNPVLVDVAQTAGVRKMLDAFPDSQVNIGFLSSWLMAATAADVRAYTERLMEESRGDWQRLSVVVADLDIYTPESHIQEVFDTIMRFM